jgi:NitT/TauT family transport system permease protein
MRIQESEDSFLDDEPSPTFGRRCLNVFDRYIGAIPLVAGFAAWELIAWFDLQSLRYIIPAPTDVIASIWADVQSGELFGHVQITLAEVFLGLTIAVISALIIGLVIGRSHFLERMFYPIIVFFQAIPKVALAPLWLIAFGFGIASKVAISAMVCFFPMLVGVIVGMSAMRREEAELMKTLRATQWQIFTKVQLPRALPSIFGGLEVAVLFALIGAVVGEFVGARGGLGYLISFRSSRLDLPGVFGPLVILSVIGLLLDLGTKALGKRLMSWQGE